MIQVAVLDDYQNVARSFADWSVLDGRAVVTVFADHLEDDDALVARLQPFEIICVMRERTPLPRVLLERLPRLKLIVTTGARNASIDLKAAGDLGILVCHTGYFSSGAIEMTWALLLGLLRHVPQEAASLRAGGWQRHVGGDLAGCTLGIVGLGRIGGKVAEIARAFDMKVIAWSQNLTAEKAVAHGATWVSRETLFADADIVTLHLILSARTRGLIGQSDLARMKPSALLVNTARGPIIDEAALIESLRAGRIAGAALDVYDREPLPPEHPFHTLRNCLATPHIGYVTQKTYDVFFRDMVEDIDAYLRGAPIRILTL